MITYQEELFKDIYEEMKPLLELHWEELAVNKDIRPLDVDVEGYTRVNEAGLLRIYTVREDNKLIGYAAFVINRSLHYKTWTSAICDVYYIDPVKRKSGLGLEFFKLIVLWLRGYKVNSILTQDKVHKPHKAFFEALGFKAIETNYEMII